MSQVRLVDDLGQAEFAPTPLRTMIETVIGAVLGMFPSVIPSKFNSEKRL
jgi:hypothetical protein